MIRKPLFLAPLGLSLLLAAAPVWANLPGQVHAAEFEDKQFVKDEEAAIGRVTAQWAKTLSAHDPIRVAALYDEPFVLYATFKTQINTMEGLVNYFTDLFKKEDVKVVFNEQNIRVYGATAVNSGLYTFSYKEEGKRVEVEARFTFVYALTPAGWRIVDHHSSVLPE
jgi:uncharacterized protein (TIGR02246 family)